MWVRFKTNYIYSKPDEPTQWQKNVLYKNQIVTYFTKGGNFCNSILLLIFCSIQQNDLFIQIQWAIALAVLKHNSIQTNEIEKKKSNITNTKSTTIPALHNSINRTLSQPKNTKISLLFHKLERAKTTNNSPQQSDQPLKETQRKHDQKHIKLSPFSY